MKSKNDITGLKVNKLTVLGFSHNKGTSYYWNCLCDCGKTKIVRRDVLVNKSQKSCGCILGQPLPNGEAAFNYTFLRYKQVSVKRDQEFNLSEEQFKNLILSNCHYCNSEPQNEAYKNSTRGSLIYNGIDRKNNTKGYIIGNCVTCCKKCNFLKKDYSYEEFLGIIEIIYNNRIRR